MINLIFSRRAAFAGLGTLALAKPAFSAAEVDLALVLAIDCSFSVDHDEYKLQMRGFGQAFMDPEILEIIGRGGAKQIAVAAFHWSDHDTQQVIMPWRILQNVFDASKIANLFFSTERLLPMGMTATGSALLFAQKILDQAPATFRKVVDVSTDGKTNNGSDLRNARDQLVAQNIIINGLAIINAEYDLVKFVEENVIGGDSSFVITAADYQAFAVAIREKLFKEITNALAT